MENNPDSPKPSASPLPAAALKTAKPPFFYPLVAVAAVAVLGGAYGAYRTISKNTGNTKSTLSAGVLTESQSVKDYYYDTTKVAGSSFKLYGKVSQLDSSGTFSLTSGETSLTVYFDNMTDATGIKKNPVSVAGLNNDDYIVVTGNTSPDGYYFWSTKIEKTTEAEVNSYIAAKKPSLSMSIVSSPGTLKHGCSLCSMSVNLRNSGQTPVEWSKMFAQSATYPTYTIFTSVNGMVTLQRAFDTNVKGYVGFKDFGTLDPGEEKVVEFGCGGGVTQGVDRALSEAEGKPHTVSAGGNPNLVSPSRNSGGRAGANTVQFKFALAKDNLTSVIQDPDYRSESNIVTINVENGECDLTDVTDTQYIN